MSRICILTDNTAQFHNPVYPGHQLVYSLPTSLQLNGRNWKNLSRLKLSDFPRSAIDGSHPKLLAPSSEEIQQTLEKLCHKYGEIIALLASPHMNPTISKIINVNNASGKKYPIRVIDSQTTAVGLGLLVQIAAEAAMQDSPAEEIVRLLRKYILHIYAIFVTQSLTYLHQAGIIDPGQALVGEIYKITPIFFLDKGRPVPIQKARSSRHLADILFEFISEFDNLSHIALIQGNHPFQSSVKHFCERVKKEFKTTQFQQHYLDPGLASFFGPGCLGLIAMEQNL